MRLSLILCLLLSSAYSHALFQEIYRGYLHSERLEEITLSEKITDATYKLNLNRYDWTLDVSAQASDSNLNSLFSFQAQRILSKKYSFGVSKKSFKYGVFSLSHIQTDYDLSNWSASSLSSFSDDQMFEARNQLGYSYDFLKRISSVELAEIEIQKKSQTLSQSIRTQQDHFDFFVAYSNAKLRIMLDKLNRESEQRAKERVQKVSKRVKDGLSRRVDFKQARLALLTQQDQIIQNKNALREKVAFLEHVIKAPITESDYKKVRWSFKPKNQFRYLFIKESFQEVTNLKYQKELTKLSLLKLKQNNSHSLNLQLSYAKNAIEAKKSNAISDSFGAGNREEKIIGLNYSFPIGLSKNNALKQKTLLEQNQAELKIKNRYSELLVQDKTLVENIDRLVKAISLVKRKVTLSKQVVKETQSYYLRGQSSFEETLRAEEAYISARVSQVNMFALYENALAKKAFINGKILKFLAGYVD